MWLSKHNIYNLENESTYALGSTLCDNFSGNTRSWSAIWFLNRPKVGRMKKKRHQLCMSKAIVKNNQKCHPLELHSIWSVLRIIRSTPRITVSIRTAYSNPKCTNIWTIKDKNQCHTECMNNKRRNWFYNLMRYCRSNVYWFDLRKSITALHCRFTHENGCTKYADKVYNEEYMSVRYLLLLL